MRNVKRIERKLELKISDKYDNGKTENELKHIATFTNENIDEYRKIGDECLNVGFAIALMKNFGLSIRELEFLYLFKTHNLNGKIHAQNKLFDRIRNMKPNYVKTHQDIRLSHPITETFSELLNQKLIVKETNKFSPFVLNSEIFGDDDKTIRIMRSIKEYLYKETSKPNPVFEEMIIKIKKSLSKK